MRVLFSYVLQCLLLQVMVKPLSEIREMPNTGCYIHGLFLEGAGWNYNTGRLSDSNLMEFYTQMPVIWLIPKTFSTRATSWVYLCPVYKTPSRAGQYLYSDKRIHRNTADTHASGCGNLLISEIYERKSKINAKPIL